MYFRILVLATLPFMATASMVDQTPLSAPDIKLKDTAPFATSAPCLADLLTIQNSASIFYTYAREIQLSELFTRSDVSVTLLVPTNSAVMALARKPHQGPAPIDEEVKISEEEYDAISRKNVENWVSAHIIPSPISLSSEGSYDTLLKGHAVTVTRTSGGEQQPEWSHVAFNGNISIISEHKASNGVMYLIDRAIYG